MNIYTKPKIIRTEHVKHRKWKNDIKRKYGLAESEYHQLNESQNYVCAICKGNDDRGAKLAIDHCHTTNKVRGLLCRTCNVAIGYLNDDIALLESAIDYLKKQ
jgi:hypothetical protein